MADASSPPAGSVVGADTGVLLIDPHALTRAGARATLAGEPNVRVVGECAGAGEALGLAASLRPAVAVVDLLSAGEGGGFGLIKDLRLHSAGTTRTLVCTAPLPTHTVEHLFRIGVHGYLRKDEPAVHLIEAVRRVAANQIYLDPTHAQDLLVRLTNPRRLNAPRPRTVPSDDAPTHDAATLAASELSPAELEVLHLIGTGLTTKNIADTMCRALKTIETYRARIRAKMGLKTQTELAQFAWRVRNGVG